MSRNDTPTPHPGQDRDDALLKRYLEASALDPARPSPALRKAVLAQAHAAAAGFANAPGEAPVRSEKSAELIAGYDRPTLGNGQNSSNSSVFPPPGGGRSAANDTSWHVRAVASLAVLGLIALLGYMAYASGIAKLMYSEAGNFPEISQFYQREVVAPAQRLVRRLLERGVACGEFRALDLDCVVHAVLAPMIFLSLCQHSGHACMSEGRNFSPEQFIDTQVDILLGGLCATPPAWACR